MIERRRLWTQVETVFHEGGPAPEKPQKKAALAVVLTNPFAGRYEENLLEFMEALKPLGVELAQQLVNAMGCTVAEIEGYGKGAIVGANGELEHGALWHVPGGYGMRQILGYQEGKAGGGAQAIVPSTKKVGGPGTRLDVPITHINASYVRGHFDAMEVGIPGHPRADEIVYVLAMTDGARIHDRAGGLKAAEVKGLDGLR